MIDFAIFTKKSNCNGNYLTRYIVVNNEMTSAVIF